VAGFYASLRGGPKAPQNRLSHPFPPNSNRIGKECAINGGRRRKLARPFGIFLYRLGHLNCIPSHLFSTPGTRSKVS
jgi:hypothetical protein